VTEDGFGSRYYQKQAAQMRDLADRAPTEAMRATYERLAANLLKLAEKKAGALPEDGDEYRSA
jgi:hypothetical protein